MIPENIEGIFAKFINETTRKTGSDAIDVIAKVLNDTNLSAITENSRVNEFKCILRRITITRFLNSPVPPKAVRTVKDWFPHGTNDGKAKVSSSNYAQHPRRNIALRAMPNNPGDCNILRF
jgi:hypothetical protein